MDSFNKQFNTIRKTGNECTPQNGTGTVSKGARPTAYIENNANRPGVVVHKFLLLMSVYPNGKIFPSIVPLGTQNKAHKKVQKKKELKPINISSEEVY